MEKEVRQIQLFAKKPSLNENFRRQNNEVNLISNYLKIDLRPRDTYVRQYSIKYEPEIASDNEPLKRKILRGVKKTLEQIYDKFLPAGDTFFSPKLVEDEVNLIYKDDQQYKIIIQKTDNQIIISNMKTVNNFSIQAKIFLDNLNKLILNSVRGMTRFDRKSIYDSKAAIRIEGSDNDFLIPGYSSSSVLTESGLYIRVNTSTKFINGKTCYEKMLEIQSNYKNGECKRAITEYFKNRSVMTTYGSHKNYKIDQVSFDLNVRNKTIPYKDMEGLVTDITLEKYYTIQYSKHIKDHNQPLFVCFKKNTKGENEPLYLVPDLCYLTGMDEDMKGNESLKKNMTRGTKLTPKQKMDKIYKIKELYEKKYDEERVRIDRETNEKVRLPDPIDISNQWGLKVNNFKELKGRQLDSFKLNYKDESVTAVGKWRPKKYLEPVDLDSKSWIVICSSKNLQIAEKMISLLKSASDQMGIRVNTPSIYSISGRYVDDWIEKIESLELGKSNTIKIVLTILDKSTDKYYGDIKKKLLCDIGIKSQMARAEKSTSNLSYYTRLLDQMNSKLGGTPFSIELAQKFADEPTMIVGYDTVKCGKSKRRHVMTASYDMNISKYYTEEFITDIGDNSTQPIIPLLRKSLDFFFNKYGCGPKMIFFYRSGVSDREKEVILNTEVNSIQNLLSGNLERGCYKQNYYAQLCFLIVNKRSEAKFFEYCNGNFANPREGTVIDTILTQPDNYEFYLQPQFVNQGCATPTHFHCIYDSIGIPLEILETISYKMCYYYWNWPGPIRVPAALKFAESANKFNSTYLKNEVKDGLKNTPYFI